MKWKNTSVLQRLMEFSFSLVIFQLIARNNETRQEFVTKSNDIDLVTQTDKDVEQLLMDGIRRHFPDHK